jgi:DNA-binding IscR family transcriptional regulator
VDPTEQKVYDALKKGGKPMSAGQVAEATGLPKDEVSKIFKKLKTAGKITSPKACFYTPV